MVMLLSGIPPGCGFVLGIVSGGIAVLNHRFGFDNSYIPEG